MRMRIVFVFVKCLLFLYLLWAIRTTSQKQACIIKMRKARVYTHSPKSLITHISYLYTPILPLVPLAKQPLTLFNRTFN
jgi:hypothetical protein